MSGGADGGRVLVDARVGWGSGIGRYVENVVPRVALLLPRIGFDVLVNPGDAARARRSFERAANVSVVETRVRPFSAAEQFALARHARGRRLTWFTNYWVPLRWPGRFVSTVYDLIHLRPAVFPTSRPRRWLSRRTFAKVGRDAEAVLFISRFTKRDFEGGFGAPKRGVAVHLGVDHAGWGDPAPAPVARRKRLLVVAASKPHKNFPIVLDAWARARVPDHWGLTVVTPDRPAPPSADPLGGAAARGVDLRRGVDDAELRRLFEESAILLAPSLYEGFGLPLLEGLGAGCFVISSTAAAQVEVAGDADVLFVDPLDLEGWTTAIERTCARFDAPGFDAAAVERRNRAHAASFTWDRTAAETADVLRAAL